LTYFDIIATVFNAYALGLLVCPPNGAACPYIGLFDLYQFVGSPASTLTGWCVSTDPCDSTWIGVSCAQRNVTGLILSPDLQLSGSISANWLETFPYLEVLELSSYASLQIFLPDNLATACPNLVRLQMDGALIMNIPSFFPLSLQSLILRWPDFIPDIGPQRPTVILPMGLWATTQLTQLR
jgi:hypothetical protein